MTPLHAAVDLIDPWETVVGQPRAVTAMRAAVDAPVHAYLLVGPRGSGKRSLADAFAAAMLSDGQDNPARHVNLALSEAHPDLTVVERVGASISADQADSIIDRANRAPVEGRRKVLVLDDFHLIQDRVGPKLLKTIEEPPEGTHFVVLVEQVPAELVTVASRCVRVDLQPLPTGVVIDQLVAEGVKLDAAESAAAAAAGDLRRARILATDERVELRRRAWEQVPDRLDGTGSAAMAVVDELLALIEDAMSPLAVQHADEVTALEERVKVLGERGSGRKELEAHHKREQRRFRTDELRFGLLTLVRRYRETVVSSPRPGPAMEAVEAIGDLAENLVRNPNEKLQLQALLLELGALGA